MRKLIKRCCIYGEPLTSTQSEQIAKSSAKPSLLEAKTERIFYYYINLVESS